MTDSVPAGRRLGRLLLLAVISVALVALFEWVGLPAAFLLGPMLAGVFVALTGDAPKVKRSFYLTAQSFIGCLIATTMPVETFVGVARDWPIFLTGVGGVVGLAAVVGALQMRFGTLPGTTALWGLAPGGASAALLLAEANGADVRIVALMQYLRVAGVVLTASVVAHFALPPNVEAAAASVDWFAPVPLGSFAATAAIAFAGGLIARAVRFPAGQLLFPMGIAIILADTGLVTLTLPPWLLALAYATIGWSIGLRFSRAIVARALQALPAILLATATLILTCALFAVVLSNVTGIDLLTAYLATSPGGADSIAIIATASDVDVTFVMAMQTARLLVVMLLAPPLLGYLARHLERGASCDGTRSAGS
ncbi:AbrB family transcriptional regulator [Acuticoccus sp. M5D2P5]|uniref:AbrB family transcriptional regulator n=1 Tax=Acuticoccus kalidii TaxID=2910977 RepID=UPI001F19B5B7|nr:AbrB family transcriptional regulator [Acuticoccus kalidii]MCF3933716.1 AbrB family transcriptional regulator [Acuticoccus kalidii]